MAFTQISTKGIKDGTITGSDLATNVDLVDNQKIRFGAGDDLAIFHDGTDNLLSTVGTVLAVHRGTTNAGNPVFEVRSNHGATNQIKFQVDGDGDVLIPTDTGKLQLGVSQDLQLFHDSSNSFLKNTTGNLVIRSDNRIDFQDAAGNESFAAFIDNGAVELYHDGNKKFETISTGVQIEDELKVGINDNDVAKIEVRYSTVPTYLTSSFDGTVGEGTLSVNVPRTSDGSGSWGSHSNTGYGSSAIQVLSHPSSGGYVSFLTGNADNTNPTEKIRVDASGNVGIGTTSPAQILHLNKSSGDAYIRVQGGTNQGTLIHKTDGTLIGGFVSGGAVGAAANDIAVRAESGNNFVFAHGTTVAARIDSAGRLKLNTDQNHGPRLIVNQGGDANPATASNMDSGFFLGFTGSGGAALNMGSDGTNSWFNSGYANNAGVARGYAFLVGGSEKLRLDNSGSLNLGCTLNPLPNNSAAIMNVLVEQGQDGFNIKQNSTHHCFNIWRSASDGNVMNFYRGNSSQGGSVGIISINSSSTTYATSSDYRLKENEVAISDGITRLKTLKPYRFNFKITPNITQDGFFAHEAQAVVPEAITGTKDEVNENNEPIYQGIDQSKLVPLLTAALQEAVAKIEVLETKVAVLEAA